MFLPITTHTVKTNEYSKKNAINLLQEEQKKLYWRLPEIQLNQLKNIFVKTNIHIRHYIVSNFLIKNKYTLTADMVFEINEDLKNDFKKFPQLLQGLVHHADNARPIIASLLKKASSIQLIINTKTSQKFPTDLLGGEYIKEFKNNKSSSVFYYIHNNKVRSLHYVLEALLNSEKKDSYFSPSTPPPDPSLLLTDTLFATLEPATYPFGISLSTHDDVSSYTALECNLEVVLATINTYLKKPTIIGHSPEVELISSSSLYTITTIQEQMYYCLKEIRHAMNTMEEDDYFSFAIDICRQHRVIKLDENLLSPLPPQMVQRMPKLLREYSEFMNNTAMYFDLMEFILKLDAMTIVRQILFEEKNAKFLTLRSYVTYMMYDQLETLDFRALTNDRLTHAAQCTLYCIRYMERLSYIQKMAQWYERCVEALRIPPQSSIIH